MDEKVELRLQTVDTESLLQAILNEIDDETLETIEIERETAPAEGLASEPITVAVVIIVMGLPTIYAIQRGIEKYLESKRQQQEQTNILLALREAGTEGAKVLADVARGNKEIAITYGIPGMQSYDPSITKDIVNPTAGLEKHTTESKTSSTKNK